MKRKSLLTILLIPIIFIDSGCSENKELRQDTSVIADAMCRSIEVMNKLKGANPEDTVRINDLQLKYQNLQVEMETIYSKFRKTYESRMKDPEFNKEFSSELRKAILNCPYLSKEDRIRYEKEID